MEELIEFFQAMIHAEGVAIDKDTANQMDEDFAKTSVQEFCEQMYVEVNEFETEDPDELRAFISGTGVLTREFIEYKLAHPIKKDESKTNKG